MTGARKVMVALAVAAGMARLAGSALGAVTVTASKQYVDTKIYTLRTNLIERIDNSTSSPGDYSVVSNAAMNALSRAEARSGITEWSFSNAPTLLPYNPELKWEDGKWELYLNGIYETMFYGSEDDLRVDLGGGEYATRTRLPTMADVDGKASTNDVQLTPVYSQAPTYDDKWTILRDGDDVTARVDQPTWAPFDMEWYVGNSIISADGMDEAFKGDIDSVELTWRAFGSGGETVQYTATRARTDIVGYVLGSQTDKVLASTNALHSAIAAPTNRHALFVIDLNPGEARIWNGIELKATTNNFAVTESGEGMLFYCPTIINGERGELGPYNVGTNDWCRLFVLSKRADSDIRRWTAISNTHDLSGYAPLSLAVLVSQDKLRRVVDKNWLYEGNKELIWSFVRISDEPETDQDGRQCWRPIMPVKWYKELPDWANKSPGVFNSEGMTPYVAPWLEAISEADTSYQRFDMATNVNQSVQYVTNALGGVLNVELPIGGKTKDWVMYCNFENITSIHLPTATWWMADAAYTNAIPANQLTALYFTQVTEGVYMLSRQELTSVKVEEE